VSPAPCANAAGAPSNKAAIATEYFNICFSYAETTPQYLKEKQTRHADVPINRRRTRTSPY
jgi:hypothetical protein